MPFPSPPSPDPSLSLGERALAAALALVGLREEGGANRGEIVRRSLAGCVRGGRPLGVREGVAWCSGFAGLCEELGALPGEERPPWRAAVRELVEDAIGAGTWREAEGFVPSPGDLAIFMRQGKDPRRGDLGHVERVVVPPDERGDVETVGGNVGDAVVRRRWPLGRQGPDDRLVGWVVRTERRTLEPRERSLAADAVALSLDGIARRLP